MIELPEARTLARDLNQELQGKTITAVRGDFESHKFTFYSGTLEAYRAALVGQTVTDVTVSGFYVQIHAGDYLVAFRDGANIRYSTPGVPEPKNSKLTLEFDDGSMITATVSMYAFIGLIDTREPIDNPYYQMSLDRIDALDRAFTFDYFQSLITPDTVKLSAKGFLATGQRIPGIGNGTVQDILWHAQINPRTKLRDLSPVQIKQLYDATVSTLEEMTTQGGRDTEKNIYGEPGRYQTILSSIGYKNGCPICSSAIKKENFLGGSIYYCPICQK